MIKCLFMHVQLCIHLSSTHQLLYFQGNAGALVCVTGHWLELREGRKPSKPILQPLMHWSYWTGKRGCIDFDLNWATFMVNFTRAASSALQFTLSLLAERKWDSFFTWGSTAVWRPDTRSLTVMWHDIVWLRHTLMQHTVDLVFQYLWLWILSVELQPHPYDYHSH